MRDDVVISVKFGRMRGPDRSLLGTDARPIAGKNYESLVSLELELAEADLAAIEQAVPLDEVAGSRYAAAQMAHPRQ